MDKNMFAPPDKALGMCAFFIWPLFVLLDIGASDNCIGFTNGKKNRGASVVVHNDKKGCNIGKRHDDTSLDSRVSKYWVGFPNRKK